MKKLDRPQRLRLVLLVLAILTLLPLDPAIVAAAPNNLTVSVTGTGPTLDDAKSDAIRQALQETVNQLVVVSRAINGNRVLRDKVMSTMNGYIEMFHVRSIRHNRSGFDVSADVTVSASRIENFIGIPSGPPGDVNGTGLLAEQARRLAEAKARTLQAQARGAIFDNILRDFPTNAIQLTVLSVNLSDKDPNKIRIEVAFSYRPLFIQALTQTVRALSAAACPPVERAGFTGYPPGQRNSDTDIAIVAPRFTHIGACVGRSYKTSSWFLGTHSVVCFGFSRDIRCYSLLSGDYCTTCRLRAFSDSVAGGPLEGFLEQLDVSPKSLIAYGRFIDDAGQSADRGTRCLVSVVTPDRARNGLYGSASFGNQMIQAFVKRVPITNGHTIMVAGFDFDKKYGVITLNASSVDLARAKHFVAVGELAAMLFGQRGTPVASLAPDPATIQDGCHLLDNAVQTREMLR